MAESASGLLQVRLLREGVEGAGACVEFNSVSVHQTLWRVVRLSRSMKHSVLFSKSISILRSICRVEITLWEDAAH
eukprot:5710851-Prymnesium_polylepis.1